MDERVTRAYLAAPGVVQDAVLSIYGARLRWLRYGRTHDEALSALRASERLPSGEVRRNQLNRLVELVERARSEVPLYRDKFRGKAAVASFEDLLRLPLTEKADLRAPRERVTAESQAGRRLEEVHTSGTTGSPLTVYCDRATLQRNFAFLSRLRGWAGAGPRSRTATLAGRNIVDPARTRPPYWRRNFTANQLLLSSYHISADTAGDYMEALHRFRPVVIDSYPSSLLALARFAAESGIAAPRPTSIITSSETLDPTDRETLAEAFRCQVFDHYGAAEMAAFITQCEQGTYHVNPEFGVVEILDGDHWAEPGTAGEIVATGFINPVMPLIRYRTGDRAVAGEGTCECGRHFPIVERIEGRADDVVVTPEGRHVGRLDPVFKGVRSIIEARIVQDAADHVRIEIVPADGLAEEEVTSLATEVGRRLGPSMTVAVVRVDRVPREPSGKLRAVVREF